MSSLEANKIFGAVLGTVFVAFGASLLAEGIFHAEAPEKPGFEIVAAEPEAGGGAAAPAEDPPVAGLLQAASAEKGAAEFRKCQACHSGEKGAPNKVGPHIWDVVNRPIASISDFNYSAAMREFSEGGNAHWDYEHLYGFLKNPRAHVPGTNMSFAGISDPQGRADIIAYLRSLSDNPAPLPPPPAEGEAQPAAADVTEPGTTTQQAPGAGAESQGQTPATTPATESNQGETESLAPRAPGAASPAAPGAAPAPTQTPPAGQQQGAAPAAGGATQTAAAAAGDATAGKAVFRKCQACHAIGPNAANKIGPELNGIFGEAPAAVEGYTFSPALKEYAAKQPAWDEASMTAWLTDPKKTVPGTKMAFPGLKNPKEIADVIAYLKSFDEAGAQ